MTTWTPEETASLAASLKRVRDEKRFWPDEETFQLVHQILPVPATEVAVVSEKGLLLQYRDFAEWPVPYNRPGWYIVGGYIPWGASLRESCEFHLNKDLRSENKRAGTMMEPVTLSEPVVIGTKKWMSGEHPFGCPVSIVCVCEVEAGEIVETDYLKWFEETVPTDVPHHQTFQDLVHAWRATSPEFMAEQARLAKLLT
jgi:hypothetical protein